MAENREQPKVPTHRAFTVIRREGQDDFWLNVGLVFSHKDGGGFNIILQALPLDGKIVCRRFEDDEPAEDRPAPRRSEPPRREGDGDQVRSRPSRQR